MFFFYQPADCSLTDAAPCGKLKAVTKLVEIGRTE